MGKASSKLKLAFVVFFSDPYAMSGVKAKCDRQCDALSSFYQVEKFFYAPIKSDGYSFVRNTPWMKFFVVLRVARSSDVVYMRYPNASLWILAILILHGSKFVFEHNTIELNELNLDRGLKGRFRYWREVLLDGIVLKLSGLSLGVSEDFTKHQVSRAWGNLKAFTTFNASDKVRQHRENIREKENKVELVFIGNPAPWHGLDILSKELRLYNGDKQLILNLIGNKEKFEEYNFPFNVKNLNIVYHGEMSRDDYSPILKSCDCGIGSLGLYRLGIKNGTPLKHREYLEFNLPVLTNTNDQMILKYCPSLIFLVNQSIRWEALFSYLEELGKVNFESSLDILFEETSFQKQGLVISRYINENIVFSSEC